MPEELRALIQVEGMRVLAAELGIHSVKIMRAVHPYAQLSTTMSAESFELIQVRVPTEVAEIIRLDPKTGAIRVDLPSNMDMERMAERAYFILLQMRKSLPTFVKYM